MVGDPISDLLIQLKNAGAVKKDLVSLPYSKLKHEVADVLVKEGYALSATEKGKHKINGVERVSKPSRRLYSNVASIPVVKNGHGAMFLSTPEGILTDSDAKAKHVGGELLFKIW